MDGSQAQIPMEIVKTGPKDTDYICVDTDGRKYKVTGTKFVQDGDLVSRSCFPPYMTVRFLGWIDKERFRGQVINNMGDNRFVNGEVTRFFMEDYRGIAYRELKNDFT